MRQSLRLRHDYNNNWLIKAISKSTVYRKTQVTKLWHNYNWQVGTKPIAAGSRNRWRGYLMRTKRPKGLVLRGAAQKPPAPGSQFTLCAGCWLGCMEWFRILQATRNCKKVHSCWPLECPHGAHVTKRTKPLQITSN
jgi:hypothetical protein